jgi:acyl-homoserine-lactone acylase
VGYANIYRDIWGVPHIYAANETDALFAVGYALAEDNLRGILRAYLAAQGRLSTVDGDPALEADERARLWRHAEIARQRFPLLRAATRQLYASYVRGVRRYMATHPDRVPQWAPKLEDYLPLAVLHSIVTDISVLGPDGMASCRPAGVEKELIPRSQSAPEPASSNAFLLMPWRTAGGAVMVWADSHSDFESQREEVRIHAGRLNVSGIVVAGLPLPIIGHTQGVAWAFTAGGPDVTDCYELATDNTDASHYRAYGHRGRIDTRNDVFRRADGTTYARTFQYVRLNDAFAPIITRTSTNIYALSTSNAERPDAMAEQLVRMNEAGDIEAFRGALRVMGLFPENIVAGDVHGNGYYVRIGRVPYRAAEFDWTRPVPTRTAATKWKGFRPLDDLIEIHNPSVGYLVSTNNPPDVVTEPASIRAADYPLDVFFDIPGVNNERGERAIVLLSHQLHATPEDLLAIGMDTLWPDAHLWTAALARAAATDRESVLADAELKAFINAITTFDGDARVTSTAGLKYALWRVRLYEAAEKNANWKEMSSRVLRGDQLLAEHIRLFIEAARIARQWTASNPQTKTLGDYLRLGRGGTSVPLPGLTFKTGELQERNLRSMLCRSVGTKPTCEPTDGQRHPMLTVLADRLSSSSAVPFGQSSDPNSSHYSDQSSLLAAGKLKPTYFWPSELSGHIESQTVLKTPRP